MTAPAFREGTIHDVQATELKHHVDARGWLCELTRDDELAPGLQPQMCYVSQTLPGISRGPHAHADQTDIFCFIGPGTFKVLLWDNRPDSPTYGVRQTLLAGQGAPLRIVVPPGIVHGYKAVGPEPGLVFNAPNRLYAGENRQGPVDEVRYEDDPGSPFRLD